MGREEKDIEDTWVASSFWTLRFLRPCPFRPLTFLPFSWKNSPRAHSLSGGDGVLLRVSGFSLLLGDVGRGVVPEVVHPGLRIG
jgi:hypothetical protein